MELIKEIYDEGNQSPGDIAYQVRKASRAVVVNDRDEIALVFVTNGNYHKLPGGEIEGQESIYDALKREVEEEAGTSIGDIKELGAVIEYRSEFGQIQISYGYIAKAVGSLKEPTYTQEEKNDGFVLRWVPLHIARELMKQDQPSNYIGTFIKQRDMEFLEKVEELI